MTTPPITVRPVHVADLMPEDQLMPVYVYVVEHPEGKILVDTGMTQLHPLVDDMNPRILPLAKHSWIPRPSTWSSTPTCTSTTAEATTSTPGVPIYVQSQELDDALTLDDYTIRDWVDAPG